ncbi:MAG: 30S ribosomal protein S8 [Simkaniaceae bacterium]|nr:30S ribosomal protein S8 [Simkaniaceae bacterium]
MTLSDPIADLLTRIRNGKDAKLRFVDLNYSKMNINIVKVLRDKGYIENFLVNEEKRKIRVFIRYKRNTRDSVISGLKRMSKPGLRRYVSYSDIPRVLSGLGTAIISTPKGVISGDVARKEKVGGELLCLVW